MVRERFLRDDVSRRLGALAMNLMRIVSFAENPNHLKAIQSLLEESRYFIEWTALDAPLHLQPALVDLQIRLAVQNLRLTNGQAENVQGLREFQKDSEELLTVSGLGAEGA